MIPELPKDSKIRIAAIPAGYEITREAPIGGRHGRLFLAGFLFLWLVGWTVGGPPGCLKGGHPETPWFATAFSAILLWIPLWTIWAGVVLYFIGILHNPRPVRLTVEPNRLVWTPPYAWMTRWQRLRFWKQDRRVAKDGSLTLLLSDVSSVTLHEPTSSDDALMVLIECGDKSYQFEWLDENEAELRWLHALLQSWKSGKIWSD